MRKTFLMNLFGARFFKSQGALEKSILVCGVIALIALVIYLILSEKKWKEKGAEKRKRPAGEEAFLGIMVSNDWNLYLNGTKTCLDAVEPGLCNKVVFYNNKKEVFFYTKGEIDEE